MVGAREMTMTIREVEAVIMLTKHQSDPDLVVGIRISGEELLKVPLDLKTEVQNARANDEVVAIIRCPDGSYKQYGCGDPEFPVEKIIIEENDDGSYIVPGRDCLYPGKAA